MNPRSPQMLFAARRLLAENTFFRHAANLSHSVGEAGNRRNVSASLRKWLENRGEGSDLDAENGRDDETRTRDLCRDSERFISICKDLQEHGRHLDLSGGARDLLGLMPASLIRAKRIRMKNSCMLEMDPYFFYCFTYGKLANASLCVGRFSLSSVSSFPMKRRSIATKRTRPPATDSIL